MIRIKCTSVKYCRKKNPKTFAVTYVYFFPEYTIIFLNRILDKDQKLKMNFTELNLTKLWFLKGLKDYNIVKR